MSKGFCTSFKPVLRVCRFDVSDTDSFKLVFNYDYLSFVEHNKTYFEYGENQLLVDLLFDSGW